MMSTTAPHPFIFCHINLGEFVAADHSMRKIQPLIYTRGFGNCATRSMRRRGTAIVPGTTRRVPAGRDLRTRVGP
jgi:hypothetical protein